MSCVIPNAVELKLLMEKGMDPFSAMVEMSAQYDELNSIDSASEHKRIANKLVDLKDVARFKASESYTEELKEAMSKNIEMFGETDAVFDYLKHGAVRPANLFLVEPTENLDDFMGDMRTIEEIVNHSNQENALSFAKDISDKLGVPYNVISESEFLEMFPGKNPSTNPAFFVNGEVYFVEGHFNSSTVFHEFSHPFVKALRIDNPAVFESLWNDLLSDERSGEILNRLNSEDQLEKGSFEYMQEAMVRLMESEFNEPKKTNFITQLLYNIKQFLRKLVGAKIDISKLSVNTKLEDIVKMISNGSEIVFNQNFVTEDDIVEFQTVYDDFVNPLKKQSAELTQKTMDDYYKFIETQIKTLKANIATQSFVAEDLVNEDVTGLLDQMRKTLSNLAFFVSGKAVTPITEQSSAIDSEALQLEYKIQAFAKMLSETNVLTNVFEKKVKSLISQTDKKSDDFFESVLSMGKYLKSWVDQYNKLIKEAPAELKNEEGIIQENPLVTRLSAQVKNMMDLRTKIVELERQSVSDLLYEHFVEYNKPIVEEMKSKLQYFEDKGLLDAYTRLHIQLYGMTADERVEFRMLSSIQNPTVKQIDRRDTLSVKQETGSEMSKDSFKRIMAGQGKDASRNSGMFENYANNQDAIVSTFYMSLKNTFNELAGNVNAKHNKFLSELKPLLKAAGFDNTFLGEGSLGEAVSHEVETFKYNSAKELEKHKEIRFLSNFKDWEYVYNSLALEVKKSKEEWLNSKSDKDYNEYLDLQEKFEDFEENFMHRDFIQEYYDAKKIFRGSDGRMAKKAYDEVIEKINYVNSSIGGDENGLSWKKLLIEAKNEYRQLYNLYDNNGVLKTGNNLIIAKRVKAYLDATREFNEFKETPNQFEIAFSAFIAQLKKGFPDPSNPEYIAKVEDWLKLNTSTVLSDDFYENRSKLMDRRSELLSFMTQKNQAFEDTTELYEELNQLLRVNKDEYNVIDGSQMTRDRQKRIVELQEKIKKIEDDYYEPKTGLTKENVRRYKILNFYKYSGKVKLSEEDLDFMQEYEDAINERLGIKNTGLSPKNLEELKQINADLRNLSRPVTTTAYINEFYDQIRRSSEYVVFNNYAISKGVYLEEEDVVTADLIDGFLEEFDSVNDIISVDKDFREWFLANHSKEEDFITYGEGGRPNNIKKIYRKSAAWKTSLPVNNSSYKVKTVFSLYDLPSDFIEGDKLVVNGVPVVPNNQYQSLREKDSVKTVKIPEDKVENGKLILANIDNRGRWLPKDYIPGDKNSALDRRFIDEKYKALQKENEPLFNLLDFLKRSQIDHEKNLNDNSKRYLSFPTIRKGSLEQVDSKFFTRKIKNLNEWAFGSEDDSELDSYSGTNSKSGINPANEFTAFSRPISGNYNLDVMLVSTNIVSSMLQRMSSIEEYQIAQSKSSYSESVLNTLKESMMNPEVLKFREHLKTYRNYTSDEFKKNKRLSQIERIIDYKIKGVQIFNDNSENTNRRVLGAVGAMQGQLAKMAFAFDLVKGARNYVGGKSMMWKKALDTDGFGFSDLLITRGKSSKAISMFIKQRYKNSTMPVELQLLSLMEAVPDSIRKDVSIYGSQTVAQDISEGNYKFVVRKYLNDSVPLHQLYALLHANKIMHDGKMTALYDLVELADGKIKTKDGVPSEWEISYDDKGKLVLGKRIKEIMNEHKSLLNKTLGLAGKSEEIDAIKTLTGKVMFTMMKFFPGMLMDRYSIKSSKKGGLSMRRNLNQRRMEIGSFTSILLLAQEAMDRKGKFYMLRSYSPQALAGFYQVLAGILIQYLIRAMIMGMGFDSDDDGDEDYKFDPDVKGMFSAIRHTTSLPQLPFVSDNRTVVGTGNGFHMENYLKLQSLNLLTSVEQEEVTFNPLNALVSTANLATFKNALAEGGTFDAVKDLITIFTASERKQVYSTDAGPYSWEEKNDSKLAKVFARWIGFNGSMIDPAKAVEKRYNMLSR